MGGRRVGGRRVGGEKEWGGGKESVGVLSEWGGIVGGRERVGCVERVKWVEKGVVWWRMC